MVPRNLARTHKRLTIDTRQVREKVESWRTERDALGAGFGVGKPDDAMGQIDVLPPSFEEFREARDRMAVGKGTGLVDRCSAGYDAK